jgi:hypothetical protein
LFVIKKIDACSSIRNPSYLQKSFIDVLKTKFPKMIHNCPYKAGEKYEVNYTHDVDCPVKDPRKPLMNGVYYFPDGEYRNSYTAFVDGKKMAHFYYWFKEKTADNKAW